MTEKYAMYINEPECGEEASETIRRGWVHHFKATVWYTCRRPSGHNGNHACREANGYWPSGRWRRDHAS